MNAPTSRSTQRKLHAWELDHLRRLVADQQSHIEQLQQDLAITSHNAEFWQDQAMDEASPPLVGLTKSGELIALGGQ